ncbi:hypothetical protein [Azospirillum argentinense]
MHLDLEGGPPDKATLRCLLLTAVGAARARGITGRDALLDQAQAAVARWADENHQTVDLARARERMLRFAGGPNAYFWDQPISEREPLPTGLAALIEYAWRNYEPVLWAEDIAQDAVPHAVWPTVARALRERGSPDPRAWWLAEAIEMAAAREGDTFEIVKAWSEGRLSATDASSALGYDDRNLNVLIASAREYRLPYPDPLPALPDSAERIERAAALIRAARETRP